MAKITHLPHIKNMKSGINLHDPHHNSIFEVYFTLPTAIAGEFKEDEATLTEQVLTVGGLDALQKMPGVGSQKFFGVDVSFSNPVVDNTYADITMTLNLNLRNVTDEWVLKIFKSWQKLSYDLADGTRNLMADYVSDNLRIAEANRDGQIWRSYVFHKVILASVTGLDSLDYSSNEPQKLSVSFRSDYWEEDMA